MLTSMSKIFGGTLALRADPPKEEQVQSQQRETTVQSSALNSSLFQMQPDGNRFDFTNSEANRSQQSSRPQQSLVVQGNGNFGQYQNQLRSQQLGNYQDLKQSDKNRKRGLEAILQGSGNIRSGMRSVIGRSFLNKQPFTTYEWTEQNEESKILSSAASNSGQPCGDEDLVLDSGGRPINQYNNWIESSNNIVDGVRNKNAVYGKGTRDHQMNTSYQQPPAYNESHQAYKKSSFLGVSGTTSTLGKLLGSTSQKVSIGGLQKPTLQATQRDMMQSSVQNHVGSQLPIVSQVADEICNVLQCQVAQRKVRENAQVIKEQLLRFESLGTGYGLNHVASCSYELMNEKRMTKEVKLDAKFGRIELTYSNNALASISDFLIGLKSLPSFRDLTLIPECLIPRSDQNLLTPELASQMKAAEKDRARIIDALADFSDSQNTSISKNKARQKAKQVTNMLQKCKVDVRVTGDRLYISFFDDKSRDQISKFVSPPISLALVAHSRESPQEASFEVFGFQMQQTTDLNLLSTFAGIFYNQVSMFTSHASMRKGKIFYDEMVAKHKNKEDERRFITQQVIRKQSMKLKDMYASGIVMKNEAEVANCMALSDSQKTLPQKMVAPKMNGPKKMQQLFSQSKQVIKPGQCIEQIVDADAQVKANAMINGGLIIQECPSKAMVRESCIPDMDEDVHSNTFDGSLPPDQHKHGIASRTVEDNASVGTERQVADETELSDQRINAQLSRKLLDQTPVVDVEHVRMRNSQRLLSKHEQDVYSQGFGTFQGDSANYEKLVVDLDMKSPRRLELRQMMTSENVRPSYLTNNTNLREATDRNMNKAFVHLPQSQSLTTQKLIGAKTFATQLGYNISHTQTDSAGGEARCNEDESDAYKARNQKLNPAILFDDQDAPLMQAPDMQGLLREARMNTSDSSDMNVFDNPSIQADPKQTTQRKVIMTLLDGPVLPGSGLPPGLPMGSSRTIEQQNKRWKSTRENKNYSFKQSHSKPGQSSKILKDSPTSRKMVVTPVLKKPTPNHMINFQRQLSAKNIARGDESPSIMNQPHQERLNSHSLSSSQLMQERQSNNNNLDSKRALPQSTHLMSPGKKQIAQMQTSTGYQSQKQLMQVLKQAIQK